MKFVFVLFFAALVWPGHYAGGQSWAVYDPSNSGLPDGDLTEVTIGPGAGATPWVVTRNSGLVRFDGTTWKIYKTSNSGIPQNSGVSSISVGPADALYVGYSNGVQGFYRFDGNTWRKIPKFQKIGIQQIVTDGLNNTWVSSINGGSLTLDSMAVSGSGTTFTSLELFAAMAAVLPVDSIDLARCFSLGVDYNRNQVWFGVHAISAESYQTPMLVRYTPATSEWVVYPYDITYDPWPITQNPTTPDNLEVDEAGGIWSSLSGIGGKRSLFYFNGTTSVQYTPVNSGLPDERVNGVKLDAQGNLWVCTSNGLARFDGTNWLVFNTSNSGLPTNLIRDVAIDDQNRKWLATDRGLVLLNDIAPAMDVPDAVYLCNAERVIFADASSSIGGEIVQWAWSLGDGEPQSHQREFEHVFEKAGDYTLKLTVWDEQGSVNTVTQVIHVQEGYSGALPVRDLNFTMTPASQLSTGTEFITYPGVAITFQATEGVTAAAWNFGDGQTAAEATALHAFSGTGDYKVELTITDSRNCPGVSTMKVVVLDPLITDTVTPNDDGKNDNLYIVPLLYTPALRVVNRWGQEVYSSDSYTDGFSTGNLQDGFYYYEVSFKDAGKQYKGYFKVIR